MVARVNHQKGCLIELALSISMPMWSLCQLTHDVRESRYTDRTPIGMPLRVPRLSMMFVNLVALTGRSTISLPSLIMLNTP
jgi:hypothetical protein